MPKLARDLMTPDPVCCTPQTTLDEVARLMRDSNCGEIPVVDASDQLIGVVTDRDIVCRVVAERKNPSMEAHQIRRVPVVDEDGCCAGIIAQADVARASQEHDVAHLVREVSRDAPARHRVEN